MVKVHGKFKFDEHLKNWKTEQPTLEKVVAVKSESHFRNSFWNQGFTDSALEKWKPRKVLDAGRNLLAKSRRLMRSINAVFMGNGRIRISSDMEYGQYHNEGSNTLPKRQFIGDSKSSTIRSKKNLKHH